MGYPTGPNASPPPTKASTQRMLPRYRAVVETIVEAKTAKSYQTSFSSGLSRIFGICPVVGGITYPSLTTQRTNFRAALIGVGMVAAPASFFLLMCVVW